MEMLNPKLYQKILDKSNNAHCTNCGDTVVGQDYVAVDGVDYKIIWTPTAGYEDAQIKYLRWCDLANDRQYGHISDENEAEYQKLDVASPWQYFDDESNCCDWDAPKSITIL